ncbi:oligomeric golgi complex component, COG2-domain-containing protein [Blakeslea trispora]|nr:oligomeric golgi complex component, COG2-domain-containing protein [Blakeslea trispora]
MERRKSVFNFSDDEDDNQQLFDSIQPLPNHAVERSAFTASQFDPDAFLSSRRHLGLERMKVELNNHLKLLKSELVELINRDYQDFINLSTNLKGVDKEISQLKTPLTNIEVQVQQVRGQFQNVIQSLQEKLHTRAQLRDQKAILKLLVSIHESVVKVEDLLDINVDTVKPTNNQDEMMAEGESSSKHIERVAIEYNQMQHLVRRGKHLAFVTENEWRIARIKDTLEQKLSKTLSTALSQIHLGEVTKATKQSLIQCLRAYVLINQTAKAENIIREEFVRPSLAKIITPKAIEEKKSSTRSNQDHPLTIMYQRILAFASTDLQPILNIVHRTLKGSNYDVLVNALCLEVTERLSKECKSIFAAGQTDLFHKNYTATVSFISEIEGLCSSRRSLLSLRNHPIYLEFMKKWQLPVYFQLRFREIIKDIEPFLSDFQQSLTQHKTKDSVCFMGTKAVIEAIERCWSDQVFLYALSHRFWKLTLQLIKRYHTWVLDVAGYLTSGKISVKTEKSKLLKILQDDVGNFVSKTEALAHNTIIPKLPSNLHDVPLYKETIQDLIQQLKHASETNVTPHI